MKSGVLLLSVMGFILLMLTGISAALTNPINSTVASQTTTVPLAYRALVGIILIIITVFAVWKFFKLFIGAIFAFVILLMLVSTAYYFFKTGTFSIHNTLAFLEDIWQFFFGTTHSISSISETIGTINNTTSLKIQ
jgi:hypothetical protein